MTSPGPDWMEALQRAAPELHLVWQGEWRPGTVEPPRRLYDHELVLVRRGACEITVAGRAYDCIAPAFLIVPPAAVHSTRAIGRSRLRRLCVHFDWIRQRSEAERAWWSVVPAPFRARSSRPAPAWVPAPVATGPAPPRAEALAESVVAAWQQGAPGRLRARSTVLELFIELLGSRAVSRDEEEGRGRELALAVKDLLDAGDDGRSPLRMRLASLGRSYEHLERCFRRHVGCSPSAYRAAARIEAAKALLAGGTALAEAAEHLGFCSPSHFIRSFRQHTGTTPGRFREQVLDEERTSRERGGTGPHRPPMP